VLLFLHITAAHGSHPQNISQEFQLSTRTTTRPHEQVASPGGTLPRPSVSKIGTNKCTVGVALFKGQRLSVSSCVAWRYRELVQGFWWRTL